MRSFRSFALRCLLTGLLLFIFCLLGAIWQFGSLRVAVAYVSGDKFVVLPKVAELGECDAGTRPIAKFSAINLTSKVVSIVGSEEGCSCLNIEHLPIDLGPHESRVISVRAFLGEKDKVFAQPVILYFNCGDGTLGSQSLQITAQVKLPLSKSGD